MTPEKWAVMVILLFLMLGFELIGAAAVSPDTPVMLSLRDGWNNTPPSWGKSSDPCNKWEGVTCANNRVTQLGLSSMNLKGKLDSEISGLTALTILDLSFNTELTGSVSPTIGELKELSILILAGCRFTGNVPKEIGNLASLTFLALNSNNFSGPIPPSLGNLRELYWLDLADNQLTGTIPVSTGLTPGLDHLLNTKHFHFNKNQLSGSIPTTLFNESMVLIHVLFDGNKFTGTIPDTLGQLKSLEVLRLDRNSLKGSVPNLRNLTTLYELHLAYNQLTGAVPNLTGMNSLNYVDLSNNSFDASEAPKWFSTVDSLTTLIMENGNLHGSVPGELFGLPQLQQVKLMDNKFNNSLDMETSIGPQLQLVDLQNNDIEYVKYSKYKKTLILVGNPVCEPGNANYCKIQQLNDTASYTTSLANCGTKFTCHLGQKFNQNCFCAFPYEGTLFFKAPLFSDLTNSSRFQSLEKTLWMNFLLTPGSVVLQNIFFDEDDYIQISLGLFPSTEKYFNRSEIQTLGSDFSQQRYKPPHEFGPYHFIAKKYNFPAEHGGIKISIGILIVISIGGAFLFLVLMGVTAYAIQQKKRAERAIELSKPFASWAPGGKESGGAPQLKGARWFSYDEVRKCTNSFSDSNQIGSGGYGRVYKGILPNGETVAIKRARQGSMQNGPEFKNEIELLSRVHHKNVVALIGFCFEQGEQMLVYEYMPNGTLRDSLSGRSGIYMDWKRRLRIALGSARGLTYLHELANPPIIHRDVKSTNILLDENITAKVADFGLSKMVEDAEKGHVSTQVKGTLGYLDPEYYMTQQLTDKSDVYSFGVVMLELISARQPIEKGKHIVREVRTVLDKNIEYCGLRDIMDPPLRSLGNLIGFARFLELAMQCVEDSASQRPSMSDVVKEIETILQNDGFNTNSTSAASSATDFGTTEGAPHHPYDDVQPKKDIDDSGSFDYSGKHGFSAKIEPK